MKELCRSTEREESKIMDNEEMQKKAEAILETMKNESLRMIHSTETSSTKNAWYYSHLGSLDFAKQMGLISEERRQELYREFSRAVESNNEIMKR